ncbi:MAG: DNA polymerase III subunit beta [Alphaproteobacteria bacterium]|nr:DNA polymerase III subunit beta [Alphaproteobacteria bacterium]
MKLTSNRSELVKALGHVQGVVEKRTTIPILSSVLFDARPDGKIDLRATDLDIEIIQTASAEVSVPGSAAVPAHLCYDIIRKMPDNTKIEISLGEDGRSLLVQGGAACFTLQTLPKEDFPRFVQDGTDGTGYSFWLPATALKSLFDKTRFAMSSEETRHYLNGIYIQSIRKGETYLLRAVATDGHRLALAEIHAPEGSCDETMPGVIIPRKTVNEVIKLLEHQDMDAKVEISSTKIRFSLPEVTLTSKLVDGKFPDYEQVIPKGNDKRLIVEKTYFSEAVDRVSIISSERGRAVKLSLEKNKLTLCVNSPDAGNAREDFIVEYEDTPLEIGFNARYLLDVTSQLEQKIMYIELADSTLPTIIRSKDDTSLLYVIMPMRV